MSRAVPLEVEMHLPRQVWTNASPPRQVLSVGGTQILDGAEVARQQVGRRLADLWDAQGVEEPAELGAAAFSKPVNQVLGRLLGEAVQLNDLVLGEAVEGARVPHPFAFGGRIQGRIAQPLDV